MLEDILMVKMGRSYKFNIEHPRFSQVMGPMTSEMGTLAWYSDKKKINYIKKF